MGQNSDREYIFVTGATGFIGHYCVAELLRRGFKCALLLRPPLDKSIARMRTLLEDLKINASNVGGADHWIALEGELIPGRLPVQHPPISAIVHIAAVTDFHADVTGEPRQTNVIGTGALLDWATAAGVSQFHLVSSAYSGGAADLPISEQVDRQGHIRQFHNSYEESKRDAERLCMDWADAPGRSATIHRPSVVVGEWETGRATRFTGFYLSARATEFLDRSFPNRNDPRRMSIPLRLKGRPDECQNIVPVDYVSRMIAAIVSNPAHHGRVYHLTHPEPPSNDCIKKAFEAYFNIGGGRFVSPEAFHADHLNDHERAFYDVSRPIEHYFVDTPTFLRENVSVVEKAEGITCPTYDSAAIGRMIAYAQRAQWGRRKVSSRVTPDCAAYFEAFLPEQVARSRVAEMTALSVTMRFIIEDEPNGQWVCQFDEGQLVSVHRGSNTLQEEFGYRTTREVFWEAISGQVHPQQLFLTGRAEVYGDVEKALKMAMILHAFTREHPCNQETLADYGRKR